MNSLGTRLRFCRQAASLTQTDLGRLAGLRNPGSHVSMIESGERHRIEATTATAIARVFDLEPDWLIDGRGPAIRSAHALNIADPSHESAIKALLLAAVERARNSEHPSVGSTHTANDFTVPPDAPAEGPRVVREGFSQVEG